MIDPIVKRSAGHLQGSRLKHDLWARNGGYGGAEVVVSVLFEASAGESESERLVLVTCCGSAFGWGTA